MAKSSGRARITPDRKTCRSSRCATDPDMSQDYKSAERAAPDAVLSAIADYALNYRTPSELACETAYYCLLDTLGCGFQALRFPACTKLLGPVVPGAGMRGGVRVPGTAHELDPVTAA